MQVWRELVTYKSIDVPDQNARHAGCLKAGLSKVVAVRSTISQHHFCIRLGAIATTCKLPTPGWKNGDFINACMQTLACNL